MADLAPAASPSARRTGRSVERLTALWALAEVGLGGALHAVRLPVTGLVVGSAAIVLLALLAEAARREGRSVRRSLLGATAVVLAVKLAASPHSPVGAYLAVAFQGGLAALVLPVLSPRVGPPVVGVLALAESAVQRVIVLTVLFGTAVWEAVDALAQKAGQVLGVAQTGDPSASLWLIGGYVGLHLVVGLAAGLVGVALSRRVFDAAGGAEALALARSARAHVEERTVRSARKRRWHRRPTIRRLALAVVLLVLYGLLGDGNSAAESALVAIGRALVLVMLWAAVVAPLALHGIRRLAGRSPSGETARAVEQLPELAALARLVWHRTSGQGLARPIRFAALVAAAALADPGSASPESRASTP